MADRRVKVTLSANTREYERSVDRAANKTGDLRRAAEEFAGRDYSAEAKVGTKKAEASIGHLARVIRARLTAAVNALPDAEINGRFDTSEIRRDITGLRATLAALADVEIGADLDAKHVLAEAAELKAELAAMAADDTDFEASLDATAAHGELDELERHADRLHRTMRGAARNSPLALDRQDPIDAAARVAKLRQAEYARARREQEELAQAAANVAKMRRDEDERARKAIADRAAAAGRVAQMRWREEARVRQEAERAAEDQRRNDERALRDRAAAIAHVAKIRQRFEAEQQREADRAAREAERGRGERFDRSGDTSRAWRERVLAASRSLPEIELRADSSDVDTEIETIRGKLAMLGDKRIGVDISSAEALREIELIEQRLRAVGGRHASAQVRADTAKAVAELEAFRQHLRGVDGKTARVRVRMDARSADRDVQLIANALMALGPAGVAGAAAAGAALVALGTTAATVLAGIGVGVSALWGVGDAVGAMNDLRKAQAYPKPSSAGSDNTRQVERARQQVVRAEVDQARAARDGAREIVAARRSVEDASTQAADANAQASRRVQDATRAEADAHKRVTQALTELSDARQQAVRDMEDMQERGVDLARDAERADIRLIEARDELITLTMSGTASELDLRKARLAVADAENGVTDVARDAQRAREELTAAERTGTEGMRGVVSARDSVADAEQGVLDARRAVSDAQADATRTEREGARAIADAVEQLAITRERVAERNVDAAQRVSDAEMSVGDAVASTASAMAVGATEARNLAEAMGELSPAQRDFAQYLYELQPQLKELRDLAAAGFLPGLEDGIDELLILAPNVERMFSRIGDALGVVSREGGDALNDPFWRGYINFLGTEAEPTLSAFFGTLEKLSRGVAGLQMGFNPLAQDMMGGLEDWADRFAMWSSTLDNNNGFQGFVAYVRETGPQVLQTLGSLGDALWSLIEAAAPVGPLVLGGLRGIAEVITMIAQSPLGTPLIGLAVGLGSLNLALRGMSILAASKVGQLLYNLPTIMATAGTRAGAYAASMGASTAAASRFATAGAMAGTAMSFLGRALPIVAIGAIGAGIAMDAMFMNSREAMDQVAKGGEAAADAWARVDSQTTKVSESTPGFLRGIREWGSGIDNWVKSNWLGIETTDSLTQNLAEQRAEMTDLQRANYDLTEAQGDYQAAVDRYGESSPQALNALESVERLTRDQEIAAIAAAEGVDRLTAAMLYQRDAMIESHNAGLGYERSLLNLESAQGRYNEAVREHGPSSYEARDASLSLRESYDRVAQAAGEKAAAEYEATGQTDLARGASSAATAQAIAQRDEYYRLAGTVDEPLRSQLRLLGDQVANLPDGNFTVTGNGAVNDQVLIGTAHYNLGGLNLSGMSAGRFAGGGVLPGWSPGRDIHRFTSPTGGTLDLSGGEAVMRPEFTDAVGGPSGVAALNWAARRGELPSQAFANGGVFSANGVSGTGAGMGPELALAVRDQVAAATVAATTPYVLAGIVAASSGGHALEWARGEAGKPYRWGAVGPDGYDCSGFMSALTNVLYNRFPHTRLGTTGTFPWAGMRPGVGPGLTIGSTRDAGNGIGHMAGTIAGVNVESRGGGVGVLVGDRARGARDALFDEVYHYPVGNVVPGESAYAQEGGGPIRSQVMRAAARYGWGGGPQWQALDWIIQRESGWNPNAANPRSSARGLFQKMTSIHGPVEDTPYGQAVWGTDYIKGRYGTPTAAKGFWMLRGHYADGGTIPGLVTGRDDRVIAAASGERVLTIAQNRAFESLVDVLMQPRPMPAMFHQRSAAVAAAPARTGPAVQFGDVHLSTGVDLQALEAQMEFSVTQAGL